VVECRNCTTSAKVKNKSAEIAQETVQELHTDSAEIAPYNNTNNNTENNISSNEEIEQSSLVEKKDEY
jgi:hypothetical protein